MHDSEDLSSFPNGNHPLDNVTASDIMRLGVVWSCAGILGLVVLGSLFTFFLGHNRVSLNEDIYQGFRYTNTAGSSDLETREGWGLTTYGENGMVVNKKLIASSEKILFLGDSFVQARQVSDDQKFTELIERSLNASNPDKNIQTLNFGFAGQDLRSYLNFSKRFDELYHPKLVVIVVNEKDFSPIAGDQDLAAKIERGEDSILVKKKTYGRFESLANDLGVRAFGYRLRLQSRAFQGPPTKANAGSTKNESKDDTAFKDSVHKQIDALKSIWGDRLVLVFLQSIPDFGKNEPEKFRSPIIDAAADSTVPCLNLYPAFLEEYRKHQPTSGFSNSILGSGHLNQHGHTVFAQEFIKFIQDINAVF